MPVFGAPLREACRDGCGGVPRVVAETIAWLDAHGHLVPRWQSVCGDPSFRGDVVEAAAGLDAEGLHGLVSEKYRED